MFYDNFKSICDRRKMLVSEVMDRCGLPRATAYMWKKRGSTPNAQTLKKVADVLNCTSEDLLSGEIKAEAGFPDGAIPIVHRTYKVLGNIACGEPVTPDQTQEVLVSPFLPEADFILRAHGDSMTGDRIHDGDLVFIRQQETVDNGQIAAVLIDGETTLKHFYFYPETQTIALHPSNPAYRPMIYHGAELENIRVQGKVVAVEFPVE